MQRVPLQSAVACWAPGAPRWPSHDPVPSLCSRCWHAQGADRHATCPGVLRNRRTARQQRCPAAWGMRVLNRLEPGLLELIGEISATFLSAGVRRRQWELVRRRHQDSQPSVRARSACGNWRLQAGASGSSPGLPGGALPPPPSRIWACWSIQAGMN